MLGLRVALVACSRLSDSGEGAKEWGRLESVRRAKKRAGTESFLLFFFGVRAFSIPRSRSLEQATLKVIEGGA